MATAAGQNPSSWVQSNGVLPITASQTAGNFKANANKSSGPRLKVVVRRLAPGLTEPEFVKLLGDDWKLGGGKVDWFSYKSGKDSKDLSKPSRPSRAYLHLTSDTHLLSLSDTVRQISFEDALNTWNSPALLGPPSVEFAPYGRIPSGRRRTDARQGTIDQDREFMDFLESLANPVSTKEAVVESDGDGTATKGEKVTVTPLVQFLKDKKANKVKEAAASKAAKHARQESATKAVAKSAKELSTSTEDSKKTPKEAKKERLIEKAAAREAVKVLSREASTKSTTAASTAPSSATTTPPEPPKNPRGQPRERGSIAAAARILQRDLGLSPANAHRRAKADADSSTKSADASSQHSTASASVKASQAATGKGRANRTATETDKPAAAPKDTPSAVTLLKKPADPAAPPASAPAAPPTAPATMPAKATPSRRAQVAVPSAGATRAFIKHANPSQGVTEPLLKEAMEVFGAVSHVEIDKRKGFAYVDFVEPDGLVKAMAANPTKIAQGTVQVLERKDTKAAARDPPAGPAGRGGFQGQGRGRSAASRRGRGGTRGSAETASVGAGPAASTAPPLAPTGPAAAAK